ERARRAAIEGERATTLSPSGGSLPLAELETQALELEDLVELGERTEASSADEHSIVRATGLTPTPAPRRRRPLVLAGALGAVLAIALGVGWVASLGAEEPMAMSPVAAPSEPAPLASTPEIAPPAPHASEPPAPVPPAPEPRAQ